MKHAIACAAIFFSSGCIAPDGFDDPASEAAASVTSPRLPYPGPKPADPPEYLWASDGHVFDFDSFSAFGANLVDPTALMVQVPYVEAGERITVDVAGDPYAEHAETDVSCVLKVHVADGLRSEDPIETGGGIVFSLDDDALQARVSATGEHIAAAAGITTVRILGRVSRPDRFCGLQGAITVRVTHTR
jgi:hypothetical protein